MTDVMGVPTAADADTPIGHAGRVSPPATEFDPKRVRRLRQYTWWTVVPMAPLYAGIVALDLGSVRGNYGTAEFALLCTVATAITVEATRLCLGMMRGLGQGRHPPTEQAAVFVLALAAMAYALSKAPQGPPDPARAPHGLSWVLFPAVLAGAMVATASRRTRWGLAIGTTVVTGSVAAITAGLGNTVFPPVWTGLYGGFAVAFTIFIILVQAWFWDVVLELDRARSVSAELAVTRERLRFAAELHDVQGHHLQAIALKGELAERLVGTDDRAARAQAAEVAELARTTLRDTREVVHGYRRSNLATELDNAREILEAAGITTTVDGEVRAVAPALQPLFGALVREGATNILRHSRARHCEITITTGGREDEVLLRNDGVHTNADVPQQGNGARREHEERRGTGEGSGVEGLRRRFGTLGGRVRAEHCDGWFELSGRAEEPGEARA